MRGSSFVLYSVFFCLIFAIFISLFREEAKGQAWYLAKIEEQSKKKQVLAPLRVMLDPGHGGVDSGARNSRYNLYEKELTLSFAKELQAILQKNPHITVRLTRDKDIFLKLSDRVEFARQWDAQLFISIHADSTDEPQLRGATIYTLSDEASDQMAEKLAKSENKADIIGQNVSKGPVIDEILFDLLRKETYIFSVRFADKLVRILKADNINLIKNPHRYANFQVLKAPDVPSILIELGYLSNIKDAKLIASKTWRRQMAHSLAYAIEAFFRSD